MLFFIGQNYEYTKENQIPILILFVNVKTTIQPYREYVEIWSVRTVTLNGRVGGRAPHLFIVVCWIECRTCSQ